METLPFKLNMEGSYQFPVSLKSTAGPNPHFRLHGGQHAEHLNQDGQRPTRVPPARDARARQAACARILALHFLGA